MKIILKNFSFILLLLGMAFQFSCSKKDSDDSPNPLTTCRPESTVQNFGGSPTDVDSIVLIYNPLGQLVGKKYYNFTTGNYIESRRFTYDSNGKLFEFISSGGKEERHYNANGTLNKTVGYINGSNGYRFAGEIEYKYTNSDQIKQINSYKIEAGNKVLTAYRTFTLNKEGLIAIDSFYIIPSNGIPYLFTAIEYTYDDKIGISLFDIEPSNLNEAFSYFPQKHNVVSETMTQNGVTYPTVLFQYDYNSYNYPVKVNIISNGTIGSTLNIKYACN